MKSLIMKKVLLWVLAGMLVVTAPLVFSSFANSDGEEHAKVAIMKEKNNKLTAREKADGWILMFDGKTTGGWRGYNSSVFPQDGWIIEDGAIRFVPKGKDVTGTYGGDIIFDRKFKDFDFKIEWKIATGSNSGIFYLGIEIPNEPIWKSAPEVQVLDNDNHPDAKLGKNGNRQAGSLYDLIPAVPQNSKPVGEWNQVEIMVRNGTVVHMQNGVKVVEYQLASPQWEKLISESKFAGLPEFGKYREGIIGLQDHGNDVWYRNIKIKPL
jgi:hypothetical protein